jgi:hypothetical protein
MLEIMERSRVIKGIGIAGNDDHFGDGQKRSTDTSGQRSKFHSETKFTSFVFR